MHISFAPSARMILDQLSPADRQDIDRTLGRLAERVAHDETLVTPDGGGRPPYSMVRASQDLRVLFERSTDTIEVIDIATRSQLSFFRRASA